MNCAVVNAWSSSGASTGI